jgi:regulator of cell morphogenesis and NO signaling
MDFYNTSLEQIAQTIPGASSVFNEYKLSFCCGGQHTLAEAAAKARLDADEINAALMNLVPTSNSNSDWQEASNKELIEHILERFHQVHREQLVELIRLAERVETVHGNRPECPNGLADHLHYMKAELEGHMQKEEQILFPMLVGGMAAMATGPINVMRQDHDDHAQAINKISELTNNITPPEGACNTWRALYLSLQQFKDDLEAHIDLENNVLFARVA